jgi:hypothetical protein
MQRIHLQDQEEALHQHHLRQQQLLQNQAELLIDEDSITNGVDDGEEETGDDFMKPRCNEKKDRKMKKAEEKRKQKEAKKAAQIAQAAQVILHLKAIHSGGSNFIRSQLDMVNFMTISRLCFSKENYIPGIPRTHEVVSTPSEERETSNWAVENQTRQIAQTEAYNRLQVNGLFKSLESLQKRVQVNSG